MKPVSGHITLSGQRFRYTRNGLSSIRLAPAANPLDFVNARLRTVFGAGPRRQVVVFANDMLFGYEIIAWLKRHKVITEDAEIDPKDLIIIEIDQICNHE